MADQQMTEADSPPGDTRIISGFWRRGLAFMIDCLILFLPAYFSGLFLYNFYAQLGGWGRLLGFAIALLYFGLWNSSLGKGRTPGKGMMKIEVVNGSGKFIPLGSSCLRFTVLATPWFLNDVPLPACAATPLMGYGLGILFFGLGGAISYLYFFNRRTRQSLHDLAAGTFVVRTVPKGPLPRTSVWKTHLVVVGVWFLAVMVSGFFIFLYIPHLSQQGASPELAASWEAIKSSGKFQRVLVSDVKSYGQTWEGTKFKYNIRVATVTLNECPENFMAVTATTKEIATIILNNYPDIWKYDFLYIEMRYGYDLGIAWSWWYKWNFNYSPSQWQEFLGDRRRMVQVIRPRVERQEAPSG